MRILYIALIASAISVAAANNGNGLTNRDKMDNFKRANCIKMDINLPTQAVGNDGSFKGPAGVDFSMDDCVSIADTVFSNAKLIRGDTNEEIPFPELKVCAMTSGTTRTTVARNALGTVTSAFSINTGTGLVTEYAQLNNDDDVLVEVNGSDYDEECLSKFRSADPPNRPKVEQAHNMKSHLHLRGLKQKGDGDVDTPRELYLESSTCQDVNNRDVIEVSLGYDQSFCDDHGGDDAGALSRIAQIFDYTSNVYR